MELVDLLPHFFHGIPEDILLCELPSLAKKTVPTMSHR